MRKKILLVFGTRPEAIKMLPLVIEFQKHPEIYDVKVCVTAQHREMLDQVLTFFEVVPDYDLNLMKPDQNLNTLTASIILEMKAVLDNFKPDYVFVHGDTTTTMVSALASFYFGTKICHVEAGLRTNDKWSPFPEEMNRQITSRVTDIHFAPTAQAQQNLLDENIKSDIIIITGNTVIDALYFSVDKVCKVDYFNEEIENLKKIIDLNKDLILVTGHRRENFGSKFIEICSGLKDIAENKKNVQIIYPVHLNPNVQKPVYEILQDVKNIDLIEPLSYPAFVWLMNHSKLIITDSGGVQEEAPSLGKPVLVMRDTTERPEALEAGTVILVGSHRERIVKETLNLLTNSDDYEKMSKLHNPYGDGSACKRIVEGLKNISKP